MRKMIKRYRIIFAALALMLIAPGCVWLRMLELKSQLSHFDENFRISSSDTFTLQFLHPVLYNEDYLTLARVKPTSEEKLIEGARWIQLFHKLDAHGQVTKGRDIVFTLDFDQHEKLYRWEFSPAFMIMMPAKFFEASLRSLGKGKVDQDKKQMKVDPEDLPKLNEKPPKRAQIIAVLGEPTEQSHADGLKLDIYRFQADSSYIEPEYEDRRKASAKLFFDPKTDELKKVTSRFLGLKFSIDFRNLIQLEALGKNKG